MRSLVLVVFLSQVALADPKAVEALVKKNVVELGKLADNDVLGYGAGAIVIDAKGSPVDMASDDGCVTGAVANRFYGCVQASIVHTPGAIAVGADAVKGIAWFQAPYTSVMTSDMEENAKPEKIAMRTRGIAIKNGKAWEIVAQMYSHLVSDKQLLAGTGGKPAAGPPKLAGDTKLAGVVAGWFSSGFGPNVAKTGTVIASGTSAKEFKTGAAAGKLAASFDKLKLGATRIEAKLLSGGAIGWVTADVMMPRKNGKGAVEMKLALVVVPDGDSWRWVSMQYQFATPIGY